MLEAAVEFLVGCKEGTNVGIALAVGGLVGRKVDVEDALGTKDAKAHLDVALLMQVS